MSEPITLTGLLAICGVVLSCIGLGWNIYRDFHDQARRLKVEMGIRRIVRSPDGKWYQLNPDMPVEGASAQLFLVANVTNIGRRPIKWMGWGGRYYKRQNGKGAFIIQPTVLPIMLVEGESASELTGELEAAGSNVKRLFVYDNTGTNWYVPRRMLKQLKKDCQEFSKESSPAAAPAR